MDCLATNLSLVDSRWPDIARQLQLSCYDVSQIELIKDNELSLVFDRIQIASSYDQVNEANLQISSLSKYTENATLYGTGLGVVQTQLLKQQNLKSLVVVILNLALFKASLSYFTQQSWLLDPRVTLKLSNKKTKVSNPFIALPAELVLATNVSAALRDRLCLSLDHDFIVQHNGIENTQLLEVITSNINYIDNDHDVSELFLTRKKENFIICGAGPTLSDHFDFLKRELTRDKFTLIAVDAAVIPLAIEGITPDIIVSIDPVAKRLFDDLAFEKYKNIPLVYFPVLDGDFLSSWQGPRYVAYSASPLYKTINKQQPKGRLYCSGSVIHPSIDLSVKMGANKVLLLGADFSFPDGKSHTYWQEDSSTNGVHISTEKTPHWVLNSLNERVPTLLNYRGYLRDLEDYIALAKHVDFFNGSDKGAFIEGTKLWTTDYNK